MPHTFIIAEAGSNHDGDVATAKRLCMLAKNAGCDAVKFQYCSDYETLAKRRHMESPPFPFSIKTEWLDGLKKYCDELDIEFMCTVYLPQDIATIDPYVKRFKISSFEAEDDDFIARHLTYGKPVLISLGMKGKIRGDSTLALHCTSSYPCPEGDADLRVIGASYLDGLSDHTKNPLTGALAVACGAKFIETHFRLNDTPTHCPDYEVARSPEELIQYTTDIRQAKILLGDGKRRIQPSEEVNLKYRVVHNG